MTTLPRPYSYVKSASQSMRRYQGQDQVASQASSHAQRHSLSEISSLSSIQIFLSSSSYLPLPFIQTFTPFAKYSHNRSTATRSVSFKFIILLPHLLWSRRSLKDVENRWLETVYAGLIVVADVEGSEGRFGGDSGGLRHLMC
ncbi:hypothetical protein DOTSEDRAFT_44644 [Dothistroma septosporum NZE10]|uniref:Uncharacterized protein n=1 Tax=Dothistroma septosporum (strain NZE10 / CBS 128990) TaxID=675120 RepID=N1PPR4_DOTSN|nr:hypothetical protein DOTSEDRAFT_44644 [Dothistroma septosporum NZE10]